jgi:hypothetical protein
MSTIVKKAFHILQKCQKRQLRDRLLHVPKHKRRSHRNSINANHCKDCISYTAEMPEKATDHQKEKTISQAEWKMEIPWKAPERVKENTLRF